MLESLSPRSGLTFVIKRATYSQNAVAGIEALSLCGNEAHKDSRDDDKEPHIVEV